METKEITKIPWDKSVWFFDIDDTLIDTAGTTLAASYGIQQVFEAQFGQDKAKQVQENFNKVFNTILAGHQQTGENSRGDYESLLGRIESLQARVKEKYGSFKKWSREVFIKIAADDAGLEVTPDLVHQAANAYWLQLTEKTEVFPGVTNLMVQIQKHQRPVYLITSSDARLKMERDGQFDYDPSYSEALKRERIELLRQKGIVFNAISVGDPEDKPHLDFFQKGIRIAEENLGSSLELPNAIIIGDSFAGDLQVPKEQLGFGLVVLFNKNREVTEVNGSRQISTGNLSTVTDFLS